MYQMVAYIELSLGLGNDGKTRYDSDAIVTIVTKKVTNINKKWTQMN